MSAQIIQRRSYGILLCTTVLLHAKEPAATILDRLRRELIDDSITFPADPINVQERLVGRVTGNRFHFARIVWFRGRLLPVCYGRVISENHSGVLIKVKIVSYGGVVLLSFSAFLAIVLFRDQLGALIISLVIIFGVLLRLNVSFRYESLDLEKFLLSQID